MNEDQEENSQAEIDEARASFNDSRLKIYDAIADSADEVRLEAGDLDEKPEGGPISEYTDPDVAEAQKTNPDPTVSRETKHKLKVNGQERELTTEELIALAGKVAAADDYLAQSKKAFEAVTTRTSEPSQDVPNEEQDFVTLARVLQMGTEEEAAEALKKLSAPKAPSIDVDVLASQLEDKRNFQDAANWVQNEYSDIWGDSDLRAMMLMRDEQLTKSQDGRTYKDRYKAIGDELRAKFKPGTQAKTERKSATVLNLPTASARLAVPTEDDSEENPSDVVKNMARARHQNI